MERIALTLDATGTWRHDGQVVRHKRLSALLHRSVARAPDGALVVTTGRDVLPFRPSDAPKFVTQLLPDLQLTLLGGTSEPLDKDTPITIDEQGVVRSRVAGEMWARWGRSATQALLHETADDLEEDGCLLCTPFGAKLRLAPTSARDWAD